MQDYLSGVIETLGWLQKMLEEGKTPRKLKTEVQETLKEAVQSASKDFRTRIRCW